MALSDYTNAYQTALSQNADYYDNITKGYQNLASNQDQMAQSLGQNQLAQANQYYDQQSAATEQSANARGLGNTTVRDSLQQGVNSQRNYDINQINNNVMQQRLGQSQQNNMAGLNWMGQVGQMRNQLGQNWAQMGQQNQQFGQQLQQQGTQFNAGLDMQRQQLAQQQSQYQGNLGLSYAQLAQQGTQFNAGLQARQTQPYTGGGGGGGYSSPYNPLNNGFEQWAGGMGGGMTGGMAGDGGIGNWTMPVQTIDQNFQFMNG